MFRSTLLRRLSAALCMALMMGGVVSVGDIVTRDGGWAPHEFAFHADVHAQECDGGGGDQGDRPECEKGEPGGNGGGDDDDGGGCDAWCWIRRAASLLGIICRFTDHC